MSPFEQLAQRMRLNITGLENSNITMDQFMGMCVQTSMNVNEGEIPKLILPVNLPSDTKKNKYRLIDGDKKSPMGIIIKDNHSFLVKCAVGSFNVYELIRYFSTVGD